MIVKNGADTIVPVLQAIAPHIDHWTILDTGSTDNTVDLITSTLADVSGNLHQEPFVDFKVSRNRVLDLAGTRCRYTIMLDDSYVLKGGAELRRLLEQSEETGYSLRITDSKESAEYYSLRILKTSSGVRYKYRIHEIPDFQNPLNISEKEIEILDLTTSKQRKRSYDRFRQDLRMLLLEHSENPRDTRILRYLGTTSQSLGQKKEAFDWFSKLLKIKSASDEERYTALVHSAELLYKDLGGSHTDYIKMMERAATEVPYRAEAYYKLAVMYRNLGFNDLALQWISLASNIPIPAVVEPIDVAVYKKDIPYFMIELCLQMKIIDKIVPLVKKMLSLYPTEQRFLNIKHAISTPEKKTLKRLEKPVVVFHLGDQEKACNPKKCDETIISYVQKIGGELLKNNYRVIVFANFGEYECNHEGIDYIHHAYFSEFVDNYYIHVLVSTSGRNMCLYDNVERVYLWPFLNYEDEEFIQIHPLKFKGVLTFSKYQAQDIQKSWMVPDVNFIQMPYAINSMTISEKVGHKFVYQSDGSYDLASMYSLWPAIREKYPDASLVVVSDWGAEPLDESVRVVRDGRSELSDASVWISFREEKRSCSPEVLEAQMAGCLCMGVSSGPMVELLGGGKGVILDQWSDEKRIVILEKIFYALENKMIRDILVKKSRDNVQKQTFEEVSREWCKMFIRN